MSQADNDDTSTPASRPDDGGATTTTERNRKKPRSGFNRGAFCTWVAEGRAGVRIARYEDLAKKFRVNQKTIGRWARELRKSGQIEVSEANDGMHKLVWRGIPRLRSDSKKKTSERPPLRLVSSTSETGASVSHLRGHLAGTKTPKKPSNDNALRGAGKVIFEASAESSATSASSSQMTRKRTSERTPGAPEQQPAKRPELYTDHSRIDDGRVNLPPLIGNAVVALICALGAAAFVWLGIHALDVTLRINGWFAASIAGTEETRPLFATAFNVIGYLAAGGPIAAHILFTLRLRSAAWLATGFAIIFAAFGIFAASGFVATNTDASSEERRVLQAQLSSADADVKRAQEAIEKAGVLPDEAIVSKDLASSVRTIRGGERACNEKKLAQAVAQRCERVRELREDLRHISTAGEARKILAEATAIRKTAEAEARAKGITIGSEVNPMAAKLATVTPLSPESIGLIAFFLEAWGPELAVLVCFWLAGLLGVNAATTLFRVDVLPKP